MRATKVEKERRILQVMQFLIEGRSRGSIKQSLLVENGIKRAQVDWYIRESTKRITEEFKIQSKDQLDSVSSLIASRMDLIYKKAMDNDQSKLALDALVSMQKLYGIGKDTIAIEKIDSAFSEVDTADLLSLVSNDKVAKD